MNRTDIIINYQFVKGIFDHEPEEGIEDFNDDEELPPPREKVEICWIDEEDDVDPSQIK